MYIDDIYKAIHTVGAFIIYKKKFAFMIGPNSEGDKLGIVRFGGHIEKNEDIYSCLSRELLEELSVTIQIVNSPVTYYKRSWDDSSIIQIKNPYPFKIQPLALVGDNKRSTALFLAYTNNDLKPSSETHGIILLNEDEIRKVCCEKMTLNDFINSGGEIIQQKKMNYETELLAGLHVKFLYSLIECDKELINKYIEGNMPSVSL